MIVSFKNKATKDIFDGVFSKKATKLLNPDLWEVLYRKFDLLNAASELRDLKVPPSNKLEKLSGDRSGQYSIRINRRYRVCFKWVNQKASEVEVVDYH